MHCYAAKPDNCCGGTCSRLVNAFTGCTEDRLDHQLGGGLYHSIPYRRNAERPFPAPGLWNQYPPHRLWSIRLAAQLLSDTGQPLSDAFPLDRLEALPIHSRRALIGPHQLIGMGQNILAVHLVVEQVEAVSRFVLRLTIQLDRKFPNLARCCQTHRQSPHPFSFTSTPEAGALSSASVTRHHRSYDPLRLPDWPSPWKATFGDATSAQSRVSPNYPDHLLCMPCSLPRWTGSGARRLIFWRAPAPGPSLSVQPSPLCRRVGIHNFLSRPAQASLTLRPAKLLTHHTWALSRGSVLASSPAGPLASYQVLPTTAWVGPSPTGNPRPWGALHRILCTVGVAHTTTYTQGENRSNYNGPQNLDHGIG